MKQRRIQLLNKLWSLDLSQQLNAQNIHILFSSKRTIQRRHSYSPVDKVLPGIKKNISNETFQWPKRFLANKQRDSTASPSKSIFSPVSYNQKYILESVEKNSTAYAKFVKAVNFSYEKMCNSCRLLEALCKRLLVSCSPHPKADECSVHKVLFMSKVLRSNVVKVRWRVFP